MKKLLSFIFLTISLVFTRNVIAQSFFSSGDWYKFAVTQGGIHSIGLEELREIGLDVSTPENIHIYGGNPEMLPQRIDLNTTFKPEEVSFWLDSNPEQGEAVFFVGRGPVHTAVNDFGEIETELNLYSDTIFYYFTTTGSQGSLIPSIQTEDSVDVNSILYGHHHLEKDEINILGSGREWYSDEMTPISPIAEFTFDLSDFSETLEIGYNVVGSSSANEIYLDVSVADTLLSSASISSTSKSYGIKAKSYTTDFLVPDGLVSDDLLKVDLELREQENAQAIWYLDYIWMNYHADVESLKDNKFYYSVLGQQGVSKLVNTSWNLISTDLETGEQNIVNGLSNNGFQDFVLSAFNAEVLFYEPGKLYHELEYKNKVGNFDLTVSGNPEMIILYHSFFEEQVNRLMEHKASLGLSVIKVNVDEVFEQYSSGKRDVSAIRNYMKDVYDSTDSLQYLLIFGDCSYDYKKRISNKENFVPVYQSRQSFHDVQTYTSDDYYGFLEDTDGDWLESTTGNHFLNIAVGRLPVSDIEGAANVVDKIINYETTNDTENWKNNIVFVADDGDKALHVEQVNELVELVQEEAPFILEKKIYLDAYERSGDDVTEIENELNSAIEDGAMVVNFTGHGTEYAWTQEEIFTIQSIRELTNYERLPVVVTATCEFGRFDDPTLVSGAESFLLSKAGAIALVTTTRPVYSSSNFTINKAFYNELLLVVDGNYRSLGDVFVATKNSSLNSVFNRNFSLLGDPSLHLKFPKKEVEMVMVNSIPAETQTDTLIVGERFSLNAKVNSLDGIKDSLYNGVVKVSFYDEPQVQETYGYYGQKTIEYVEDKLLILEVDLPVVNGEISGEFIFPVGVNSSVRDVDIVFYAYDELGIESYGAFKSLTVGGLTSDYSNHEMEITQVETSQPDGTYTSDPEFIFEINDENGILFSDFLIGRENYAVLDDGEKILINEYLYLPDGDAGSAELKLNFNNLSGGEHTLKIYMYDALGNGTEYVLNFTVGNSIGIYLYPNPVSDKLFLNIERSNSERAVSYELQVFNILGENVLNDQGTINSGELEFTKELLLGYYPVLAAGMFSYRISVNYDSGDEYLSTGKFTKD